jgi:hypothetical protein
MIGFGVPRGTEVKDGAIVTVRQEADIHYAGQAGIWSPEDKAAQAAEDEYSAALAMFAEPVNQ